MITTRDKRCGRGKVIWKSKKIKGDMKKRTDAERMVGINRTRNGYTSGAKHKRRKGLLNHA